MRGPTSPLLHYNQRSKVQSQISNTIGLLILALILAQTGSEDEIAFHLLTERFQLVGCCCDSSVMYSEIPGLKSSLGSLECAMGAVIVPMTSCQHSRSRPTQTNLKQDQPTEKLSVSPPSSVSLTGFAHILSFFPALKYIWPRQQVHTEDNFLSL